MLVKRLYIGLCIVFCALFAGLAGVSCNAKTPTPEGVAIGAMFMMLGAAAGWFGWKLSREIATGANSLPWTWVVWYLFIFCPVWIITPVFQSARAASVHTICRSNLKQMLNSILIYVTDFDDKLPLSRGWRTSTVPYRGSDEDCPLKESLFGYGFSAALSGKRVDDIDTSEPVVFDMEANTANASGGEANLAYRHGERANVVDLNGFLRFVEKNSSQYSWKRKQQ